MSAPFLILTKTIVDNSRSTSTQPHRRADQGCIGKFLSGSGTCDLCETRARPYPWQIESLRRWVTTELQRQARQARQLISDGAQLGSATLSRAISAPATAGSADGIRLRDLFNPNGLAAPPRLMIAVFPGGCVRCPGARV